MSTLALADPFHSGFPRPSTPTVIPLVPAEALERTIDETSTVVSGSTELETTSQPHAIDLTSAYSGGVLDALRNVEDELTRYEEYPIGWDGYSGEAFSSAMVQRTRQLARLIASDLLAERALPDLFTSGPASDGSIDLELRLGKRRLFFTLYPEDQKPEVAAFDEGKPANVRPSGEGALERWVDWLVG